MYPRWVVLTRDVPTLRWVVLTRDVPTLGGTNQGCAHAALVVLTRDVPTLRWLVLTTSRQK